MNRTPSLPRLDNLRLQAAIVVAVLALLGLGTIFGYVMQAQKACT